MRHIGIYFRTALMAGSLLFCACNKDELISGNENTLPKSEYISFGIKLSGDWTPDSNTKGMQHTRSEALPMESANGNAPETEIQIYMIEEDLPTVLQTNTPETKAEDGDDIGIIAYQLPKLQNSTANDFNSLINAQGAEVFMGNINLSTYGVDGGTSYKYWPGAGSWLKFFAYSPYCTSSTAPEGEEKMTAGIAVTKIADIQPQFEYKVPVDVEQHIDLMEGTTVENGKDIMVPGDMLEEVSIELNHILSQIQVKAGTFEFGEGYIKSVSFKNIHDYGTKNMISGDWETGTNKADFTQDFTEADTGNGIDLSSLKDDNRNIGSPYYFIPQTLPDDAIIEIVLAVKNATPEAEDNVYTLSKKLKDFTQVWKPDKKYTYVISTPEEVEVEVSDEIENNVKKNFQITNTGLSDIFIRACIVGNWVIEGNDLNSYDDDVIVADWKDADIHELDPDEDADGKFYWGNGGIPTNEISARNWIKGNDGYFYYLEKIERGKSAEDLFEKYELSGTSPTSGAILEMVICVEAVSDSDVESVQWPKDIIDKLKSSGI